MTRRLLASFMAIALLSLALLLIPLGVSNARSERRDLETKVAILPGDTPDTLAAIDSTPAST